MELKEVDAGSSKMFIKKFDINELYKTCMIGIVGNHETKSIVKEIIYNNKNKQILVINPTESHEPFYSKFISNVFTEYSDELIFKVLNEQGKKIDELREKNKIDEIEPYIVVLDNCINNSILIKDQYIDELIFNGIFYNITTIIIIPYLQLSVHIRSNCDYIFLLADDSIDNRKKIYDNNREMFPSFDIFEQVFQQLTENDGIMVFDNSSNVYWLDDIKK